MKLEPEPGSAAATAGLDLFTGTGAWTPGEIALGSGASRHDRAIAERLLAGYLKPFCEEVIAKLLRNLEFSRHCALSRPVAGDAIALFEAERADLRRLMRRAKRIYHDPHDHARRELRRLCAMLERVPFERLVVSASGVTACVRSFAPEAEDGTPADFDVHLPNPTHPAAPVYIRPANTSRGAEVFTAGRGCHGACRGEAEPLVGTCQEQVDLAGLVLTALAWARRNVAGATA